MTTHISYETAKRLKEFLGDSAPEPIKGVFGEIWLYDPECPEDGILQGVSISAGDYPAYQLHDLLSKEFCEAMEEKYENGGERQGFNPSDLAHEITSKYYDGGLPAVEKALLEMMEGK